MSTRILDRVLPELHCSRRLVLRGAAAGAAAIVAHWFVPATAAAVGVQGHTTLFDGRGFDKIPDADVITQVEEAALRAADQAIEAQAAGTFGVGGLLLDSRGHVLQTMRNTVVRDGVPFDTTAHGERQLVDWYFHTRNSGIKLPPPNEVICVTSLDPCLMCAGSLLVAGFQVVVIAHDDFAGVNFGKTATFTGLRLAGEKLRRQFNYVECSGSMACVRASSGAPLPQIFAGQKISARAHALNVNLFQGNRMEVQTAIRTTGDAESLMDPANLAPAHPIVKLLRDVYPNALAVRTNPDSPGAEVIELLQATSNQDRKNGGRGDAVLVLDAFGNALMSLPGQLGASPIRTTLMETLRGYMAVRWKAIRSGVKDANALLCHPKRATFVFLRCPNDSMEDLVSLGAYSAATAGTQRAMRFIQGSTLDDSALLRYFGSMPPLYRSGLTKFLPTSVADGRLLAALATPIAAPN